MPAMVPVAMTTMARPSAGRATALAKNGTKMKIYRKTRIRLAKAFLGKRCWEKMNFGATLKPGDLIGTCKGYNEVIKEIWPEWRSLGKGRVVVDFYIETEAGSSCSLYNCCCKAETREEIIAYWLQPWPDEWACFSTVGAALRAGKEVFDEKGQLNYEYCSDYEKKARFHEENIVLDGPENALGEGE